MAIVEQLYRLETLDSEIERLAAELSGARRTMRENPELARVEGRVEVLHGNERTTTMELRAAEAELEELEGKIGRDERRMYSGQIVDARELGSLEREIAGYRERRDGVEERVLTLMERLEAVQAEVAETTRQRNELRSSWEEQRPLLAQQIEEATRALSTRRAEREELSGTIDGPSLDLYDRVRARGGHALSPLSNGVCGTCRVTLPPKDVQHVRGGALVTCTNCSRILYAGRS